jgi:predicted GIY-YIG superfamily endonuclease
LLTANRVTDLPVVLAYSVECADTRTAVVREHQIKMWTRQKKLALIRGDFVSLRGLAKRTLRKL